MFTKVVLAIAAAVLILPAGASGADVPQLNLSDGNSLITGGNPRQAKAVVDTIQLMGPTGSGAAYLGDFEAGWNGWTSTDLTQPTVSHWQVGNWGQADPGQLAAWCGDAGLPACSPSDSLGGYGNSWHDIIECRLPVADPGAPATVRFQARLTTHIEPGYDYCYLTLGAVGMPSWTDIASWDTPGYQPYVHDIDETFGALETDYLPGGEIQILFRFRSDGGFSDEDCSIFSAYACQLDDVTVTVSQAGQPDVISVSDFQDGTLGDWSITYPPGVGNFAHLWTGLNDADPCVQNTTTQIAFIDDGLVVPGTGGSNCLTWCYGPGGYVVNTTGGLAGPYGYLDIRLLSPVMAWPDAAADGMLLEFGAYVHEELTADSPGVFYYWDVFSADTDNSAGKGLQDILIRPHKTRYFVQWGGPMYRRHHYDVSGLLSPGRDEVQVMLGVAEWGWMWGWTGNDATPAPYLDNVSVKVFDFGGPTMSAYEQDLAQDAFPEADMIDTSDLGALHVRFDAARNISPPADLRNDPGDSVAVRVVAVRAGGALTGPPIMHYVIDANPAFDAWRTTATSGTVPGSPAVGHNGFPNPERWAFDLPDTGTLFPGDVLHYYVRAADDVAGDVRHATLPADLTGFGDFAANPSYDGRFTVRALPTLHADGVGGFTTPPALFWNDATGRGGDAAWQTAFQQIGAAPGQAIDIYTTRAPAEGAGNGLGGRTAGAALAGYDAIFYAAGDLTAMTLTSGQIDPAAGDDLATLETWLSGGSRGLFLSGDGLAGSLDAEGSPGTSFRTDVMGLDFVAADIRNLIGTQVAPLVVAVPGNPVFATAGNWIAYGGCPGLSRFDAVTPRSGAVRLAEFTDPNGFPGAYPYSAATLNPTGDDLVISLPYDLANVTSPAKGLPTARTRVLSDVSDFLGVFMPSFVDVPETPRLAAVAAPNPFNPLTRIAYTLPAAGPMRLCIYDVRGALVRQLVDGPVPATGRIAWDGTDDRGGDVASGVYFYEVRAGAEVKIGKMALVR